GAPDAGQHGGRGRGPHVQQVRVLLQGHHERQGRGCSKPLGDRGNGRPHRGDRGAAVEPRGDLDTDIAQLETAISDTRKTMDEAQETRDAELKQYEDADDADLRAALDALRGAIKELKAAKTFVNSEYEGFLQTKRQALGAKVQHALLLAEALGFAPEAVQRATAFFQQGQPSDPAPQIPTEAYTFKSGTIIETLE
ncbi:unnamed protein product, partial [Prorocentrum cordatum]